MAIADHLIFGYYGFWPPNDPRGSWSKYVASRAIYEAAGPATTTDARRSLAKDAHEPVVRRAARGAMARPPVRLDGRGARAVARGLARAAGESGYAVYACCVMPDHAHLVVRREARDPFRVMAHLKARATRALLAEGLHPFGGEARRRGGRPPAAFAKRGWVVYLDDDADVRDRIGYVQDNPPEIGLPRQFWRFLVPFDPPPDASRERDG